MSRPWASCEGLRQRVTRGKPKTKRRMVAGCRQIFPPRALGQYLSRAFGMDACGEIGEFARRPDHRMFHPDWPNTIRNGTPRLRRLEPIDFPLGDKDAPDAQTSAGASRRFNPCPHMTAIEIRKEDLAPLPKLSGTEGHENSEFLLFMVGRNKFEIRIPPVGLSDGISERQWPRRSSYILKS